MSLPLSGIGTPTFPNPTSNQQKEFPKSPFMVTKRGYKAHLTLTSVGIKKEHVILNVMYFITILLNLRIMETSTVVSNFTLFLYVLCINRAIYYKVCMYLK